MSATVAAALKKVAVTVLTDKNLRKTFFGIVLGVIVVIVMPFAAITALFQGDITIDTDRLQTIVVQNLSAEEKARLRDVESLMYEIEDKMTAAGFDAERVKEAQVLYVMALAEYASDGGFADRLVGCFAFGQSDAQLIAAVNSTFGTSLSAEEFTKIMSAIRAVYISTAGYIDPGTKNNLDLVTWAKNAYGVAGLMGNLYAESGLLPNNLQDSYETALGYSDSSYTQAVDSGSYTNFSNDSAGYGLAQWTASSRKRDLLAFANERGCSISDLDMQLDFLCEELETKFPGVLSVLKNAQSVREASDYVLFRFEAPLDQSESVQIRRAANGSVYYNRYG